MTQIGFGGGCHWCTEAVFQSLRGVVSVAQGFIASTAPHAAFSEGVVVDFDAEIIPLDVLIAVHLRTHASTAPHKMRGKYRSAVYTYGHGKTAKARAIITAEQPHFDAVLITLTLPFAAFKPSDAQFQNYYATDASRPFCTTYIDPKLARIRRDFGAFIAP